MKLDDFVRAVSADEKSRNQLKDATNRWRKLQRKVRRNVEKIKKQQSVELETPERLRSFVRNTIRSVKSPDALIEIAGPLLKKDVSEPSAEDFLDAVETAKDSEIRELTNERIIGTNNLLPVEFFERAVECAKAIGRISAVGSPIGTGFFVGERIVCTNNHVIASEQEARVSEFEMNIEDNFVGEAKNQEVFEFEPDRFFHTDKHLDVTFVSTKTKSSMRGTPAGDFGECRLIAQEGKIIIGRNVNIIQHPGGANKAAAFRDGFLIEIDNRGESEDFCYYTADTKKGSSGSPVFNDLWQIIALHHRALPKLDKNGNVLDVNGKQISEEKAKEHPELIAWEANEGARTSRIIANLKGTDFADTGKNAIRDAICGS